MHPESAIIERVETPINHHVVEGSNAVMETVLADLESRSCAHQISQATCRRLREMILRSPHGNPDDSSGLPEWSLASQSRARLVSRTPEARSTPADADEINQDGPARNVVGTPCGIRQIGPGETV
jgi:hypothetical protein